MANTGRNRFQRGSGCYTCLCCGKRTRSTGNRDNEFVELCVRCYEIAGDENAVSDGWLTREDFIERWGQEPEGA